MSVVYLGGSFSLDKESEEQIPKLAMEALRKKHSDEYEGFLKEIREIVYIQEIASFKKYLERKHPEQVEQIYRLRGILNHERSS